MFASWIRPQMPICQDACKEIYVYIDALCQVVFWRTGDSFAQSHLALFSVLLGGVTWQLSDVMSSWRHRSRLRVSTILGAHRTTRWACNLVRLTFFRVLTTRWACILVRLTCPRVLMTRWAGTLVEIDMSESTYDKVGGYFSNIDMSKSTYDKVGMYFIEIDRSRKHASIWHIKHDKWMSV